MEYPAHGSYTIEKNERIMLINAQGPFNDITTEQYQQDFKTLISQMSGKAWALLLSINADGIFIPEAEQRLKDTTQYRMENGMVAIAVVITDSRPYTDMLQMQLQRIYQSCDLTFNFFSDTENAKNWLDNLIN